MYGGEVGLKQGEGGGGQGVSHDYSRSQVMEEFGEGHGGGVWRRNEIVMGFIEQRFLE